MKKITFLLISCGLLLFACESDDTNTAPANSEAFVSITALQTQLTPQEQTHTITDPTVASTFTGSDGTIISISPNAFKDGDGNTVTTPVTIILDEYLTLNSMIKANIQTISNGGLLVSGGSFEIDFKDDSGNSLTVEPWTIDASFSVNTTITGFENSMNWYVGERVILDNREQVNWNLNQNSEFGLFQGQANFFGIDRGLANCDVLYDLAQDTPTQFQVEIEGVTDYSKTTVWMIINDFPSVINITTPLTNNDGLKTYDNSIPVGLNATLLAISLDANNYLQFGTLDITVAGDDTFIVPVDYGTSAGLNTLISGL